MADPLVTTVGLGGLVVAFLAAYVALVVAGARRGRAWPWWRTVCAVAGTLAVLVAVGPIGLAGHHDFVVHMWGHLLLGMLGPLLLVLSAPVTVALRGLSAPRARRLSGALSWPYVRFVAHPVTAAVLDVGGLWLLYTTPLHGWMHASTLGHLVVHTHVLLAGWVFAAAILQVDPAPHPYSHHYRAVVLVAFMAAHGILCKVIYAHPPTGVPVAQAESGAQLMFYGGDYIDVVLIALFCLDWYRRTAPAAPAHAGVVASAA
ncbi:cytochrome c oxidase assembly protein [Mobilicoccus pelagius]|uniref:Cytochrome c oxidase assembly protein n=1 Tax=Mobilicoccus pelagius NBRC 104925 TaxID=1089455 RepID=H5USH4_9MICO|nr:cytochrome c oxidase assembly protein [Mobilicoccus pelagius]GAB48682.1 hypothetical protein MOPEL_078_00710 [Mobilicoccus pelagius NBRC 104925]